MVDGRGSFDSVIAVRFVINVDLVRELVDVALADRKIVAELLAGTLDGVDDSLVQQTGLKVDRETRGDLVPEACRHFLVDPAVPEDDETLFLGGDEEKHTVAELR